MGIRACLPALCPDQKSYEVPVDCNRDVIALRCGLALLLRPVHEAWVAPPEPRTLAAQLTEK